MVLHPDAENVASYQEGLLTGRCVVQIALFSKNATLCSLAKLFALGGRREVRNIEIHWVGSRGARSCCAGGLVIIESMR
jgi:hypothetical protein